MLILVDKLCILLDKLYILHKKRAYILLNKLYILYEGKLPVDNKVLI